MGKTSQPAIPPLEPWMTSTPEFKRMVEDFKAAQLGDWRRALSRKQHSTQCTVYTTGLCCCY